MSPVSTPLLLALIALTVLPGVYAASGVRCTENKCAVSAETISLTCGSADEIITKVTLAEGVVAGSPSWTCDAPSSAFVEQCGRFQRVKKAVKKECLKKSECEIWPPSVLPPGNVTGCEGAKGINDLALAVTVECEAAELLDPLALLSLLFIAFVMLAMGATLEYSEFIKVVQTKKKGVFIGWGSQFGVMPLMAFIMVQIADFDVLTSAGIIMSGCAPGGSTSNLFTYWSGGDVALSIVMSAMSTLCAIFMFPFLVWLYVTVGLGGSNGIEIPLVNIFVALLVIIIPASLGVAIRNKTTLKVGRNQTPIYVVVEKIGSALGAVFLITGTIQGIRENPNLFRISEHPALFLFAALFQPLGCGIGYGVAFLLKMDQKSRIAVSLETGVQNYPLVLAVIALSFTGCERVKAVSFVLLATLFYSVNSAWICYMYKNVPFFATAEEDTDLKLDASP